MSSSHTALDPTAEPRSELAKQVEQEHAERHSSHGEVLRDIILGVADGLTVPFALTAGLSSCVLLSLPSANANKLQTRLFQFGCHRWTG
jgi:hypothetical protein